MDKYSSAGCTKPADFFCAFLLLTKGRFVWYNGRLDLVGRAENAQRGPNSRSHTPYANFFQLLAPLICRSFFPKPQSLCPIICLSHLQKPPSNFPHFNPHIGKSNRERFLKYPNIRFPHKYSFLYKISKKSWLKMPMYFHANPIAQIIRSVNGASA